MANGLRRNASGQNPPKKGGGKRCNRDSRRAARRAVAEANADDRALRSAAEQVARLRAAGHGHCREVERLLAEVSQ